jgi:hypothetical protein
VAATLAAVAIVDCAVTDVDVGVVDIAVITAPVRRDLSPEKETDEYDESEDRAEEEVEEHVVEEAVAAGVAKAEDINDDFESTTLLRFVAGKGKDGDGGPVGMAKILSRSRKTFFHTNGSTVIRYHCRETYEIKHRKCIKKVSVYCNVQKVGIACLRRLFFGFLFFPSFDMAYLLACSNALNVKVTKNLVCNLDGHARDNVHGHGRSFC